MNRYMLAIVACVGFALAAMATDYTVDTEIALTGDLPADHTFNVAKDVTVTVSVAINDGDAAVGVTKQGAGTLKLSHANGFSGGLNVQAGPVWVCAAGALGSGDVSIASGANANGALVFDAQGTSFDNDISITTSGSATYAISVRSDVTLNGDIVGTGAFNVENVGVNGTSAGKNFQTATYNGLFSAAGAVTVRAFGTNVFNGKISMASSKLTLGAASSNQDVIRLNNSANEIKEIGTYQPKIFCGATGALGGAVLSISKSYSRLGYCHCYYLGSSSQTIGYFSADQTTASPSETAEAIHSDEAATLTLTGKANTSAIGTYRMCGQVSLVIDAPSTFSQTLTDIKADCATVHNTEGSIWVKSGKLILTGGSTSFPNVPEVTVNEGASLDMTTTAGQQLFDKLTTLNLNGQMTIGASAANPFATEVTTLVLGDDAELTIAHDQKIPFLNVKVDGQNLPAGTYTAPDVRIPQLKSGTISAKGTVVETTRKWTGGGGADTSMATASNWDGTPDLQTGYMSAQFADAGTQASVSGLVKLRDVSVKPPTEAGFSFTAANANAHLELTGTNLKIFETGGGVSFNVPVVVENGGQDFVISLTNGVPFAFCDGYDHRYGKTIVDGVYNKDIIGRVAFAGTNVVGGMKIPATYRITLSGIMKNADGTVPGPAVEDGDSTLTLNVMGTSVGSAATGLVLTNAVVGMPVWILGSQSSTYKYGVHAVAGTTNVITGELACDTGSGTIQASLQAGSELTLTGGVRALAPFRLDGASGSRLIVAGQPMVANGKFLYDYKCARGFQILEGEAVLNVASNACFDVMVGRSTASGASAKLVCGVSGALSREVERTVSKQKVMEPTTLVIACGATSGYYTVSDSSVPSTVELNATTQTVARLISGIKGVVNGASGALLEVAGAQVADEAVPAEVLHVAAQFTGASSLKMSGTGTLLLTNAVSSTTGTLEVTNGVVALAANATWANVSRVAIGGEGRLTIQKGRSELAFGKNASLSIADTGILDVADGETVRFLSVEIGGVDIAPGTYTYATAPQTLKAHLAATTGSIRIGRPGLVLFVK